ncbi:unnamed protein product, partial [Cyprideis torosa]
WTTVDLTESAILEICVPNEYVVLKKQYQTDTKEGSPIQSVMLSPNPACVSKLIAIATDHLDTLLEDWYPSLALFCPNRNSFRSHIGGKVSGDEVDSLPRLPPGSGVPSRG